VLQKVDDTASVFKPSKKRLLFTDVKNDA